MLSTIMRLARPASLVVVVALASDVARGAMDLTEANFDKEVFNSDKSFVFVKFLAPW